MCFSIKKILPIISAISLSLPLGSFAMESDEPFRCKVPRIQAFEKFENGHVDKKSEKNNKSVPAKIKRIIKELGTDLSLAYCIHMGAMLVHEIAHAICLKTLCNAKDINIFLGPSNKTSLISIGNLHVTSLLPSSGGTRAGAWSTSPGRAITMLAAGPIAGAAFSAYCYKKLAENDKCRISRLISLFLCLTNSLNGIPLRIYGDNSDGMRIKKVFNAAQSGTSISL